jgi:hypothetical protein
VYYIIWGGKKEEEQLNLISSEQKNKFLKKIIAKVQVCAINRQT